jgi:uncharacterized membrane protein
MGRRWARGRLDIPDPQTPERRAKPRQLDAAEIGAIAHLYRGEVYRSTIWRTRLDTTTQGALAQDYQRPRYHISMMTAIGRRVRRNYL